MKFFLILLMFVIGNMLFMLSRKHLLNVLLSLEFIMLVLLLFLVNYFMELQSEFFFLMMFLVMVVCEGVLGIAILVLMVRVYGNDYFQLFSLLKC
uniref:NADH-ubiquinone oxidoreductase chain 4L n=1 Tax=Parapsyche difformis TaxID=2904886 RepID=A0A9E8LNK7_9NEOP|nr:NADH dehydrogenase subunit 4L [Parapsyche difformis]UZZ43684.1 NADH dehydrogenase subunit 4L [Parapsyche difformis]